MTYNVTIDADGSRHFYGNFPTECKAVEAVLEIMNGRDAFVKCENDYGDAKTWIRRESIASITIKEGGI